MKPRIASFSGGKDSLAMLILIKEKQLPLDDVIYWNGGWDFPFVKKIIKQAESYLNIKITTINSDLYGGFKRYGFPRPNIRWCTGLKKGDIRHYAVQKFGRANYKFYVGIASDEIKRVKRDGNQNSILPLVKYGITEKRALEMCYERGFGFNGYYEKFSHLNCFLCPFKRIEELKRLKIYYPELWKKIIDIEGLSISKFGKFRSDYSAKELNSRFEEEINVVRLPLPV